MNKNTRLALNLVMVVAGMAMMAYAAVPLYRLFCQKTGFDGTPLIAKVFPEKIEDREITVRFNTDIDPRLGWEFKSEQKEVKVRIGENGLAFFKAVNISSEKTSGTAMYNVTPEKTGGYFNKVKCFCFERQTLKPGEEMNFPVSFFIDPEFVKDKQMDDIDTITLSYTFYLADEVK